MSFLASCLRAIFVLLAILPALAGVPQQNSGKLPDDVPNAKRILAYVAAFNSGEHEMAEFLKENVAESALQTRPLDDRMAAYRQMRERMKTLQVRGAVNVELSGSEQSVTMRMQTSNGDAANISFYFDPHAPNKLLFLRVEDADHAATPSKQPLADTPPLTEAQFIQKVRSYLDELANKDEFSGVVLIARKSSPILQNAYGFADKNKKIPNKLDTKFNLGSINKLFTKICIHQLVQQHKLSFTDKLGKILPDYPNREAAEKVTVSQLLNMTSGIGDIFGERFDAAPKEKIRSLSDYLPLFADKPLLFEPGAKQQYSNGGYIVLGLIIEKLSGQNYYDYVKQHVFEPAGMKDTDFYFSDQKVPNLAEGYTRNRPAKIVAAAGRPDSHESSPSASPRINNVSMRPARGSSAGGGYSTASDLLSFTKALADRKLTILSEETGQPILQSFGIGGGAPGTNALLQSDPQTRDTVIVLSNYDPPSAETPARQIRPWLKAVTN